MGVGGHREALFVKAKNVLPTDLNTIAAAAAFVVVHIYCVDHGSHDL